MSRTLYRGGLSPTKPFRSQDLLDAVFAALERDSARRKMQQWQSILREHYESLSAVSNVSDEGVLEHLFKLNQERAAASSHAALATSLPVSQI